MTIITAAEQALKALETKVDLRFYITKVQLSDIRKACKHVPPTDEEIAAADAAAAKVISDAAASKEKTRIEAAKIANQTTTKA